MTPLDDYSVAPSSDDQFQLLYHDYGTSAESKNTTPMAESDRGVRRYTYRKGKALAFSSLFSHSTEPGRSQSASRPHVYLCFTFGTDKMEHWPSIYESCSYQTRVLASPDGRLVAGQRGQQHA